MGDGLVRRRHHVAGVRIRFAALPVLEGVSRRDDVRRGGHADPRVLHDVLERVDRDEQVLVARVAGDHVARPERLDRLVAALQEDVDVPGILLGLLLRPAEGEAAAVDLARLAARVQAAARLVRTGLRGDEDPEQVSVALTVTAVAEVGAESAAAIVRACPGGLTVGGVGGGMLEGHRGDRPLGDRHIVLPCGTGTRVRQRYDEGGGQQQDPETLHLISLTRDRLPRSPARVPSWPIPATLRQGHRSA